MDRLFEAALKGDVQKLHQILGANPLILHTVNPLHVASAYGHVDFVKEIIRLKPDFAKELNEDGFSPLHMASANGHLQVVRELLKVDWNLCCLQGRENKTPLHLAASKGRVDIISEILSACGDSVEDVTVQRENAVHLAIRNYQFEGIRAMVDRIREMRKEDVLNMKDEHGNTALHLAAWKKQRQVIEVLLGHGANSSGLFEINAINESGLTALDVLLIFPSEAGDREIEEFLRTSGATRNRKLTHPPTPSGELDNQRPATPETSPSQSSKDWVEYFKFKKDRDSPGEARTSLLVVAVLVATTTFQVGVNPPGSVWQDSYTPDQNNGTNISKPYIAGTAIMSTLNPIGFVLFMLFNSIGFATSLHMIDILTFKFPLQFELRICMIAMFLTYNTATVNIIGDNTKVFIIVITAIVSAVLPPAAKLVRRHTNQLQKCAVHVVHTCRTKF